MAALWVVARAGVRPGSWFPGSQPLVTEAVHGTQLCRRRGHAFIQVEGEGMDWIFASPLFLQSTIQQE